MVRKKCVARCRFSTRMQLRGVEIRLKGRMLITHHVARRVIESIYPSLEIDGLNMIGL